MPEDNILSEEYLDTGIPRYFVTLSVVDNFAKNPTKSKKVILLVSTLTMWRCAAM